MCISTDTLLYYTFQKLISERLTEILPFLFRKTESKCCLSIVATFPWLPAPSSASMNNGNIKRKKHQVANLGFAGGCFP